MVRRRRVEAAVPGAEEDQPVALVDGGRGPDRAAAAVLTRTGRRVPARVEHRVDLEAPAERARRGVERDDPAPVAVCAVGRVADVDVPLEDRGGGEDPGRIGVVDLAARRLRIAADHLLPDERAVRRVEAVHRLAAGEVDLAVDDRGRGRDESAVRLGAVGRGAGPPGALRRDGLHGALAIDLERPLDHPRGGVESIEEAVPRSDVHHPVDDGGRGADHVPGREVPGRHQEPDVARVDERGGVREAVLQVPPVHRPVLSPGDGRHNEHGKRQQGDEHAIGWPHRRTSVPKAPARIRLDAGRVCQSRKV